MSDDDFLAKTEEYGDDFRALMGAEAVRELLRTIDIDREVETLRGELKPARKPRSRRSPSA